MADGHYQPPGWYHGEGDPPGTKRYWDGELWVGEPQMMPGGPPPPSRATPIPPQATAYAEPSQATTSLVLGILGLVCCGLLGPFAWKVGSDEIRGIDSGRRNPKDRGMAMAGKILGIVSTVILAVSILALIVGVFGATFSGSEF